MQTPMNSSREPVYYLEAANGMTVPVPQSKLDSWLAAQEQQKKTGGRKLTGSESRLKEEILSRIFGPVK